MFKNSLPIELKKSSLAALALVLISVYLWSQHHFFSGFRVHNALALHTALETITLVIFVSVFIVCWNAFGDFRKRSSLILALAFLSASIFGFLHTISFQGMPGFPDVLDLHISFVFWLISRFIIACTLLGLVLLIDDIDVSHHQSMSAVLLILFISAIVASAVFKYPHALPATYLTPSGQTLFKIVCEWMLLSMHLLSAILFWRQIMTARGPRSNGHLKIKRTWLFFACLLFAISAAFFTQYRYTNEIFVVIGHSFQVLAAVAIYRGMVAVNIHAPYEVLKTTSEELQRAADELLINRKRLLGVIETAIDGIMTIDEHHKIILVNPAAAQIFGYSVDDLLGSSIDHIIPTRHRKVHNQHVQHFGETGETRRKMGGNFDDFYVTALHSDGSEFPIEASISSLIEGEKRFFTVIFRDISDRRIAKEKMAQYHTQLSQLSAALQSIREEERKHIARELHDDLGQLLAALRMDLSLLQRDTQASEKSRLTLGSMDQLLLTAITTLRRIATDLRPRALDEGGLYFALQTLQKDFSQRHGIDCVLNANEELLILDDEKSTAIFRIIQESLTNVARHAQAQHVTIDFHRNEQNLSLQIRDDGKGIEEGAMHKARSFGLVGMRERIKALNGQFEVHSEVGHGTQIQIDIPICS